MPSNPDDNGSTPEQPMPNPQPAYRLPGWRHPITHNDLRHALIELMFGLVASEAFDALVADVDERQATAAAHGLLAALFPDTHNPEA